MKGRLMMIVCLALGVTLPSLAQHSALMRNTALAVRVRSRDGSYEILRRGMNQPVLVSGVGAEIDHHWVRSTDYPQHRVQLSTFRDALGPGHTLWVTFTGLTGRPGLVCVLRLYDHQPYGDVSVLLHNTSARSITLQALRVLDALGQPRVDLGGPEDADRVMAESFSENPPARIGGLSQAPHGVYFGVRDELIDNLQSKQSLLLAALTSERFLTVLHLQAAKTPSGSSEIASLTVDSTGTTEAVKTEYAQLSPDQQIELSLPVAPGQTLPSERVMFEAGGNYFTQLEDYGDAIRRLHQARVSGPAPMGWWSWTAFYGGITAGDVLTNAEWLSQHLTSLGYDWLHIDEGYQYARGEYTTTNATQFPHGMWAVGHKICRLGLNFAIWTAPFEVSERAWVYRHHPDWLVRDARGRPIQIGYVYGRADRLYALDNTNPGAQAYLRWTYRILTRQWGVRYIKLDFMDAATVEGYHYRPNVTALQAQRLGLEIIRQAVGPDVLLDKDGSAMLNPVGLTDEGRISVDTAHTFRSSQNAAWNIAGRFYMNRNFYVSDPDAFSVSRQTILEQENGHQARVPLTLDEAQVQIVLAAVTGGMYEIGDDLVTLGSEPRRLALVENPELIALNRLGRAALPLDLMTFRPEDKQPSVFFLHEDRRQAVLAVFNWTEQQRSHSFRLADLELPAAHPVRAYDVLNHDTPLDLAGGTLRLENQPPHSVRLIKLVDTSVPAVPPKVTAGVPKACRAGEVVKFSAHAAAGSVPALSYHWDFGDGTSGDSAEVSHTYTRAARYRVELAVEGIDGLPARQNFAIAVTGFANTAFDLKDNRRYAGAAKP